MNCQGVAEGAAFVGLLGGVDAAGDFGEHEDEGEGGEEPVEEDEGHDPHHDGDDDVVDGEAELVVEGFVALFVDVGVVMTQPKGIAVNQARPARWQAAAHLRVRRSGM